MQIFGDKWQDIGGWEIPIIGLYLTVTAEIERFLNRLLAG